MNRLATTIEELSLNAWAALQTVVYDGWIIRFSNGYGRRANSVNPIYPSNLELEEKIQYCEELYRARGLPVVFKLSPAALPADLDAILAARGYQMDAPTSIQLRDLDARSLEAGQVVLEEQLQDGWVAAVETMNAIPEKNRATLRRILVNIVPRHCFAARTEAGRIVACGLGVLQSGYLGLYDIVTDPEYRQRGYGGQIVDGLLAWGQENGAKTAYLQVMLNNAPALRLYARLGFKEIYQYWYRSKP